MLLILRAALRNTHEEQATWGKRHIVILTAADTNVES